MKNYDVIILGAGASGLMCGAFLDKNLRVAIVEGNDKIAKKIKISGGGKCNITNIDVSEKNYEGDEAFVSEVLQAFSKEDLLTFLARHGLTPVVRKERYYFCKDSADEIINILKKLTCHHTFLLNHKILGVKKESENFLVQTNHGMYEAKKVVLATGAKSYAILGASDVGLQIAKSFGLKTKEFTPALVGLTVQKEQFWMKELSGLSCYVHIKVGEKVLKEEMLFAHKGISGPAVLSASLYWQKGLIAIDFLSQMRIEKLIKGSKKLLSSLLPLPKRLAKALLEAIDVADVACNKIAPHAMKNLQKIHNYEFAPAGNFGFTKAEVCRGGILSQEFNPKTMESWHVKGLYAIGEVVDVTGELGGYNFQWAFSSGVVCAKELNEKT